MSKGVFAKAEFCPFCGVRSLERDKWGETKEKPAYKNEFNCTSCGMGVAIGPSLRYTEAIRLAKDHREMRPPDERKIKVKPADMELFTLQKYAEKIGMPGEIERSKKKIGMFIFRNPEGNSVGSSTYERGMCILRGFEIARNLDNG